MYYRCGECGKTFEDYEYMEVDLEHEYGVSSMFGNSNIVQVGICPYCASEDFTETWEEEEEWD